MRGMVHTVTGAAISILLSAAVFLPAYAENENGVILLAQADEKTVRQEVDELKSRMDELEEENKDLKKRIDLLSALKISGYFDVNISNYKNKPNVFSIGAFELDLEHNYDHFQVAAALVFHEGAELGVGFIDYHLYGSRISPRGRLFQDEGLHLQVGRFDVPFGNDWYEFSPAVRTTVTPPLTTELIMEGGYNDEGVRLLFNFMSVNATLYMLDGIEEQYSFGGNSYGGRIGMTPFSNPYELKSRSVPVFELGVSGIIDLDREGKTAEKLFAADIKTRTGPLILSSEYYYRDKNAGILLYGYHVTAGLDLDYFSPLPVKIYGRFEQCVAEEIVSIDNREAVDKNSITRLTAGLNLNISDISYLKFEYLNYLDAYEEYRSDQYFSKMLYYLQLVITF